ncbi:hypothetical protein ACP275_05G029400 [Erythranthe tilingii]
MAFVANSSSVMSFTIPKTGINRDTITGIITRDHRSRQKFKVFFRIKKKKKKKMASFKAEKPQSIGSAKKEPAKGPVSKQGPPKPREPRKKVSGAKPGGKK